MSETGNLTVDSYGKRYAPVTRKIYLDAASYIETHGLYKNGFGKLRVPADANVIAPGCPTCAMGALLLAAYGRISTSDAWWHLSKPLDEHVGQSTTSWSDNRGTTAEDVVQTLRTVAATLPEIA